MRFRFVLPSVALLGAISCVALSSVAPAQDSAPSLPPGSATPRSGQPERQGPEIDVFRDPVTPAPAAAPPPVVAPTVAPLPQPAPVQPRGEAPVRRVAPTRPVPRPPITESPATTPVERAPASVDAVPPSPVAAPSPAQPAPTLTTPKPQPEGTPWGWIAAAIALLLGGIGAWLFLRPARPAAPAMEAEAAKAKDRPPVRPARPAPSLTARARLTLALEVEAARLTFAGAAVTYRLTLRNAGDALAQDIMVHALLGSADAEQRELLQRFFAGTIGAPLHSVVEIAPGKSHVLGGEIRMAGDAIVPVTISEHPLLIPLLAFDVHYRWGGADLRSGRTGAAFIVGQEQAPPTARLAPFRIDLGPRPFRRPGVRAAGEPLIA